VRALVADDDDDMLEMVAKALRRSGSTVVAVTSGGDLLEKLANDGAFDLVVTDIVMPWMTGLQVMHSARMAGLPVPVVVITSLRDHTLAAHITALGARAELLHKPFSIAELYAAVHRCLVERDPGADAPVIR
jgi:DNA-binding response OmpR family regulator